MGDTSAAVVVVAVLLGLAVRHIWTHRPAYEADRRAALLAKWRQEIIDRPDIDPPLRQPDPYAELGDRMFRKAAELYPDQRPWPDTGLYHGAGGDEGDEAAPVVLRREVI